MHAHILLAYAFECRARACTQMAVYKWVCMRMREQCLHGFVVYAHARFFAIRRHFKNVGSTRDHLANHRQRERRLVRLLVWRTVIAHVAIPGHLDLVRNDHRRTVTR